jgi:hypothetical protein
MMSLAFSTALLCARAALAAPDALPDPPGGVDVRTTTQAAVAMFPAGLMLGHEVELRVPLWDSDHLLLRDAHVAVLTHGQMTPSFARVGPGVRFAPVAVWDVTARLYGTWWWGSFTSLLPVDPEVDSTPAVRSAMMRAGERTSGTGLRADLETRLKGKAGPVVLVLEAMARHNDVDAPPGTELDWFWEPGDMVNAPARGWVLHRNAYMFVQVVEPGRKPTAATDDRRLWLGATAFWTSAPAADDTNVRVGPTVVWKPARGPASPQLLMAAQAWVDSRSQPRPLPPYTVVLASWAR